MNTRRHFIKKSLVTLSYLSLPLLQPALAAPKGYGIVGLPAPELRIDYWIDANGEKTQFKLSDHLGQWVFLKCFQSWCPGCHSHGLPAVKKISEALADNPNVVFAGIQTVFEGSWVNRQSKVRKTQLQYDLKMPMGHDPGEDRSFTMADYRTGGTPWMILINPQGIVVFNDFGINVENVIEYLKTQTA